MPNGIDLELRTGTAVPELPEQHSDLAAARGPTAPRELQIYNLINPEIYAPAMGDLSLEGRTVVELGVGTGGLTRLILEQRPERVIGFELIKQEMPREVVNAVEMRWEDFTTADLSVLAQPGAALIANPPNSQLPFIREQVIHRHNVRDVQLMIPERALPDFADYKVALAVEGHSFEPESRGRHLIVRKGFEGAEIKNPAWEQELERVIAAIREPREKFGTARRIIICITNNEEKIREVAINLSRYGIEVYRAAPHLSREYIEKLLAIQISGVTIKGVAKEVSHLTTPGGYEIAKINQLAQVDHVSILSLFFQNDARLNAKVYAHSTPGLIDLEGRRNSSSVAVFGWDDIFLLASTLQSYHQMRELGLKVSSRDLVWSDYLRQQIYYDKRVDAKFNPQAQATTVDFTRSVGKFITDDPFLNNPVCRDLGLCNFFSGAADNGLFFRSPVNRREKNYWLPGLNGGIPLTPKQDALHEITFTAHDIGHMHIPDLVVSGPLDKHERRVYMAYRMMSEAMTIVVADMAFVDTLARSGYQYDFSKRKIYPLFKALGISLEKDTMVADLKRIMHANMRYCLRGDDSEYRALVEAKGGNLQALEDFKSKYMPFFVEDFRWTEQNISRMGEDAPFFERWWRGSGELSQRYNLGLQTVADFATDIPEGGDEMVEAVFNSVFEERLAPLLADRAPVPLDEDARRTKAFARYMLGQLAIFSRYPDMPYVNRLHELIVRELREHQGNFTLDGIDNIRGVYNSFVNRLRRDSRIQYDDAETFKGVYPLFEPFYVFYDESGGFYEDLASISRRIFG